MANLNDVLDVIVNKALVQAALALIAVITLCVLYILARPVPSDLITIVMMVLGFYFGSASYTNAKRSK